MKFIKFVKIKYTTNKLKEGEEYTSSYCNPLYPEYRDYVIGLYRFGYLHSWIFKID